MNREIGAAVALSANSLRVLTYLGFDAKNLRAGDYMGVYVCLPASIDLDLWDLDECSFFQDVV